MGQRVLTQARLRAEHEQLRARVEELEETLLAIRRGQVDALVINSPSGDQVFTLQGAEHPYRVLFETINEGAATLDSEGTVLYANTPFARILEVCLEKFIGSPLQSHVSPPERQKLQALIDQGLRGSTKGEIYLHSTEGRKRLVRFSFSPMKVSEPQTICVVATELTELADASEALKTNEEALRQLSTRLLQLQDEERRRIARDLHDITGQKLAFQSIILSQMLNTMPGADAKADVTNMRNALSECLSVTQQVGEEIRTLSYLLHPPLLDELGLVSAVPWYTRGFENRTGIRVDVKVPKHFMRLPPDAEVTLFRVIQESLTNVHRYSGSSTASIRLYGDGETIRLEIADSGCGIRSGKLKTPANAVATLGVGIQGMRERMRQLSGDLEIQSKPNQGTTVIATLPIPQRWEPAASGTSTDPAERDVAAEESPRPNPQTSRRRILIADDHEVLRRGVRTMLQNEPEWDVCGEATDGRDAVEKAVTLNPDLVILDINMPVLNGLAAVRQILQKRPNAKILVFTVHESDQAVQEILAAGAHGYLSKAKAGQDLVQVVKNMFAGENVYPPAAARA